MKPIIWCVFGEPDILIKNRMITEISQIINGSTFYMRHMWATVPQQGACVSICIRFGPDNYEWNGFVISKNVVKDQTANYNFRKPKNNTLLSWKPTVNVGFIFSHHKGGGCHVILWVIKYDHFVHFYIFHQASGVVLMLWLIQWHACCCG